MKDDKVGCFGCIYAKNKGWGFVCGLTDTIRSDPSMKCEYRSETTEEHAEIKPERAKLVYDETIDEIIANTKPVTNGDRVREALRNVSDRTLAYMFNFCDIFNDDCPNCPLNGQHCEKVSPKVLYDWLQEEVSGNDT